MDATLASRSVIPVAAGLPVRSGSPWVSGPIWDGVWLLNALWLAPVVLLLARGDTNPAWSPLDTFYFALTALFWIGHRLSSAWLAYATEAYRPLLRAQPVRFCVLPLVVTLACFAIFVPPDGALPWTRLERFIALAMFDYLASAWHFGSQHFGALSLYRTRTERGRCHHTRRMDRWFALGVGGALVVVADALAGVTAYQHLWIDRLPHWLTTLQLPIRNGALAILFAATGAMLFSEARASERSLPRILYIVGLAVMVAISLTPRSPFLFQVVWTSQHWIFAAGVASLTPAREPLPAGGGPMRAALHGLNARRWMLVVLIVLVSVLLLPVFEVEANWPDGVIYYGDRLFGAFAEGLRRSPFVPALLALGFASGFVHYLLDRAVYRMSDPGVRLAASGLLSPAQ